MTDHKDKAITRLEKDYIEIVNKYEDIRQEYADYKKANNLNTLLRKIKKLKHESKKYKQMFAELEKTYREDISHWRTGINQAIHNDKYNNYLIERIADQQDELAERDCVILNLQERLKSEKMNHP